MPENTVRFESSARVRARHARLSSSRWSGERPASRIAPISSGVGPYHVYFRALPLSL